MKNVNVFLSTVQNSADFYGIRGRAVQPSHIPPGLPVLWCREVQQAMTKAALLPEDCDPANRQCMCATLFLKLLSSYIILSCFLFSFYKPDHAVQYGSQELYRPQFYTKPCNRQLLTAIFPDFPHKVEYLPQAALFQGHSMPFLFALCRSCLTDQDISALYGVEKPALKSALEVNIA